MTSTTPEDIAARIRPAMTKLYVMYFRIAEQSDLTGPQLSIMARLKDNGPARISQIAREEGIRMPTASNAVHHLEDAGMVERVRDTKDRRGVRVELTEKGLSELRRVSTERDEQMAAMFAALAPEELEIGAALVPVLKRILETYGEDRAATAE